MDRLDTNDVHVDLKIWETLVYIRTLYNMGLDT